MKPIRDITPITSEFNRFEKGQIIEYNIFDYEKDLYSKDQVVSVWDTANRPNQRQYMGIVRNAYSRITESRTEYYIEVERAEY